MAEVDSKVELELTGKLNMQQVRCLATGATSTFTSKFSTIDHMLIYDETHDDPTATKSSGVITITCTNDDVLDITVFGH